MKGAERSAGARSSGQLEGRLAVVTGASRGIGFAIARTLVDAGAHVALVARGLEALAAAAHTLGNRAAPFVCDVTDRDAVATTAGEIVRSFGATPHILVNNAGTFELARVEEMDPATFARAVDTNLIAPFLFTRALLPGMRERGDGHLVTIGSIADRVVFPENGAYAATKHGARALHEVLRAELRGSGVRVTLVSPAPVDTRLWDSVDPDNRPGFTPRTAMLEDRAVADAVHYAVTRPREVNVDELRLSRS